jgi:hypothetical protein
VVQVDRHTNLHIEFVGLLLFVITRVALLFIRLCIRGLRTSFVMLPIAVGGDPDAHGTRGRATKAATMADSPAL